MFKKNLISRLEAKEEKKKGTEIEAEEDMDEVEEQLESYVLTLTPKITEDNEETDKLVYQSQFEHCSQVIFFF